MSVLYAYIWFCSDCTAGRHDNSASGVPEKNVIVVPVTDCGGPKGCEALRLLHLLDSWLADGGEVVGLTLWPPFTPRGILGTHFC
jgi:hypothetical protein